MKKKVIILIIVLSFILFGCKTEDNTNIITFKKIGATVSDTSEDTATNTLDTSAIEEELENKIISSEYSFTGIELILLTSSDENISCSIHSSWVKDTSTFLMECYYMIPIVKESLDAYGQHDIQIDIASQNESNSDQMRKLTYSSDNDIVLLDSSGNNIITKKYTYEELIMSNSINGNEGEKHLSTTSDLYDSEASSAPTDEPAKNLDTNTPQTSSLEPMPSAVTTGQSNALTKAKQYLKTSQFSYLGLIDQLEYENFSYEDAVYAADNCGADWNQQALNKAKSYLTISAFSYQGLIEQLKYEKYTDEQATYGANNCNADWNEQASKKAASYLSISSFSRNDLIEQLKYDGFTQEQAVYGADANE